MMGNEKMQNLKDDRSTGVEEERRGQAIVLPLLCSVLPGGDPCRLHFPGSYNLPSGFQMGLARNWQEIKGKGKV